MKSTTLTLLALSATLLVSAPLLAGGGHGEGGPRGDRAKAMLSKFDSNSDGAVSAAEISQDASKRAQTIDANGDGQITVAELDQHREQQRAAHKAARLAKLDSNGDGSVSTAEFSAAHSKRLLALDSNADGVITAEEVSAGHRGHGRHGHGRHGRRDG